MHELLRKLLMLGKQGGNGDRKALEAIGEMSDALGEAQWAAQCDFFESSEADQDEALKGALDCLGVMLEMICEHYDEWNAEFSARLNPSHRAMADKSTGMLMQVISSTVNKLDEEGYFDDKM